MEFQIDFTCESHWEEDKLIIDCPTPAARDFVARTIEEHGLVLRERRHEGPGVRPAHS